MTRIAFHLRIADGKREAYREAHEDVPAWLEEAYLESDRWMDEVYRMI